MTYSNMDNVPTQTAGTSELLASDWNTYVRDNFDAIKFGHVVCTSGTRPTGVGEGTMIYETDTNKVYVYDGASWDEVHDLDNTANLPDGGTALSVLGNGTNATAARTDIAAGTDGHVLRRSGTSLAFGTIGSANFDTATADRVAQGHVVVADDAAKTALGNVAEGTMVYQSDNNKVYVNSNGTTANWVEIADLDNTGAVSDTSQGYLDGYAVQSRNVIINGAMQVAQRATSKAGITTSGYYTADRWKSAVNYGTFTHSVVADGPTGSGFTNSYKIACTTSGSPTANQYLTIYQNIEGQNLQHFAKGTSSAKAFAASFWVKSNLTGTYVATLYDTDNTRSVGQTYSISAANTWEKKTIIFPADTTGVLDNNNGNSLTLEFILGAGSGYTSGTLNTTWASYVQGNYAKGQSVDIGSSNTNTFYITGVQLEAGSVATPFEFEPFETTVRKCQRYFCKSYDIDVAPGTNSTPGLVQFMGTTDGNQYALGHLFFPVSMRAAPSTMTAYTSAGVSGSWAYQRSGAGATAAMTFSEKGTSGANIYTAAIGATWVAATIYGHYTADAEL